MADSINASKLLSAIRKMNTDQTGVLRSELKEFKTELRAHMVEHFKTKLACMETVAENVKPFVQEKVCAAKKSIWTTFGRVAGITSFCIGVVVIILKVAGLW